MSGEASGLEIRLFGPMEVRVGPRPLPRLRSRKGLWLLALLALRAGRDVDRAFIAGTLWPDYEEHDSRRSLRQSLHDLRLALGPEAWRLPGESAHTLRLDVCASDVDALAFDAAVARGDPASLEAAIRLYRGPLLEDCAEEWVAQERNHREQVYLGALQSLASAATECGDNAAAARWLRLAAAVEPYREDLQRARMQALADGGDPAAALLAYRDLRDLLRREMSIEPAPETADLFRRIRDEARQQACRPEMPQVRAVVSVPASSPSASARPRPLPVPLTELIGREEAVREVALLLARSRLVTLAGTGGIGKTRLALRIARELEAEFEGGVCFVPLAGVADPAATPDAIRKALGVPQGDARQDALEMLTQRIQSLSMLLALDNCEHLLGACAGLAETLLGHCPGLRILATSRQALGVAGEMVWRVPPLALPPVEASPSGPMSPQEAAECAAVKLFIERAQAGDPSFRMTLRNAPSVVEVCRRLDGIPLAIELAAARVCSLTVCEINRRLRDDIRLLGTGAPAVVPRHHTLEAAFRWSWDLLTPDERTALGRLSVFAGGCTLEAAEAVCAGGTVAEEDVADVLTALTDKSLVVFDPGTEHQDVEAGREAPAHYHLLEPVRQFAAARIRESGEEEEVRLRHRDYFLAWAEEVRPHLWSADMALWFSRLEADHDNLRAALEVCRSRAEDGEKELRFVVALARFWDTQGHLREGRAHLEAALGRAALDVPASLHSAACVHTGWICAALGDNSAARHHYGQALAIFEEQGDRRNRANVLGYVAAVARSERAFGEARSLLEDSIAIRLELGLTNLGSVLNNLAELEMELGDYAAARARLNEAIECCFERNHFTQQYGVCLRNLSIVDAAEGDVDSAIARSAKAVRSLLDAGIAVEIPPLLEHMACLLGRRGNWGPATRLLGAATSLRKQMSLPPDRNAAEVRAEAERALGSCDFDVLYRSGTLLSLDQAAELAIASAEGASLPVQPGGAG